ncbi:UNVERIFIED_CONTAM: (+)-neomenthol dehydrogenase [Sesamum angustifolium]|uniref:(+)-neomenthol dehydrogenase n=1 Tax=Sesamum angustifolium TaxID=2727405 RepID=A0AAW2LK25_9LAMI
MDKKEKAKERRDKRRQEISLLRTIPYSDHQRCLDGGNEKCCVGFDLWRMVDLRDYCSGNWCKSGIGFEIVHQLALHGLTVVLTSRDTGVGEEAAKVLQEGGLNVVFHQLDIVDPSSIEAFTEWIKQNYGGIDILINNAGVNYNAGSEKSVENAEKVIATNYYGTKNMIKAMIPLMRPSDAGARIVNRIENDEVRKKLEDDEALSEELIDQIMDTFLEQVKDGSWTDGGWPQVFTDYSLSKLAVNAYTRLMARIFSERPEGHVSPEDGADTAVWLALLPEQFITGKFFSERREIHF